MADNVDQMSSKETREMKRRELLKNAMKGQWSKVVEIYKEEAWIHKEKITMSGETALHIAVSDGRKEIVEQLITAIKDQRDDQNHAKEAVSVTNTQGNTALHFAASKGMEPMCQSIAEVNPSLVGCPNREGETPFFLAAFHGKKGAFLCLHQICTETNQDGYGYSTRNDGNTTLHCAINGQYFDLALKIIQLYPTLANRVNNKGLYPLHILAAKPSAFKSGKPPASIWHRAVYNRKFIDWLKLDMNGGEDNNISKRDDRDQNPETDQISIPVEDSGRHDRDLGGCISSPFFKQAFFTAIFIISVPLLLIILGLMQIISLFYAIFTSGFKAMLLLPFGIKGYRGEGRMDLLLRSPYYVEQKHTWAVQIMNNLLEHTELHQGFERWAAGAEPEVWDSTLITSREAKAEDTQDKETPILTAAKYGVIEMVEGILEQYPIAIYDKTSVTKKNIVLLAVENRQIHVYQLLLQKYSPGNSVFGHVDNDGNSALHLAAKLPTNTPGMLPAGLRVLWEIRWYQFVRDSMPSNFFPLHNSEGKTPIEIFTESHKEVIESGGKWLSSTSSSSSVVATVIASVAFATAATIPGGLKQDRGTPMYENQPTFYIFAISSLFALFFSITSAVMFIVLTSSPYEFRSFSSDLPKKLLMSLMMLFMGIVSMMISFCASHFFLFQDKHEKTGALVLYVVVVALVIYLTIKNSSVFLNLLRFTFSYVPERLDEDDF